MYSGAIHSLKEIKFEIIKRINRFCFVDDKSDSDADARYFPNSNTIVFYAESFFNKLVDIHKQNIISKLKATFLFLILYL